MTLRVDDLAVALGMSRRTIERLRSAGRFPAPDLRVGRIPLWRPETIRTWLDNR
jgi:predicted DNA-binding transcriptional regulator AlpA